MKILKFFKPKRKARKVIIDFYQDSVEKVGRDQIQKLVERGLSIPVIVL